MAKVSPFGDEAVPTTPKVKVSPFGDEAVQQAPKVSTGMDILRSIGTGLRSAVESTAGMPQDLISLAGKGAGWATGTKQDWDVPYLPGTEDINQATSSIIGPSYEPQTTAGKYFRTAAEFAPVLVNPMAGARKLAIEAATGLGAGVASEAAGQATKGTRFEPLARLVTGLAAGGAPAGVEAGVKAVKNAPGRAAEIAAEDAARQHGVNLTAGERMGGTPSGIAQQQAEQQMLKGARGEAAQRMLQQRRQSNLQAIKDAGGGFIDTAAPARGTDPVHSGSLLNEQTRSRAEGLMDEGGQKIDEAINAGVMIDADRLRGLPSELEGKLAGPTPYVPDVVIDAVNTPMAKKAQDQIATFVSQAKDPNTKEFSLAGAEKLRQTLNKFVATTPEDKRAMKAVMDHFDDWYDETINQHARVSQPTNQFALPPSKTPDDILNDLKAGRATFSEGAKIARPRGADLPPGTKQVADIAGKNALPEETARLLRPRDDGNLSTAAIRTIDRLVEVGANPADLDQVRHIVLDTLMNGDPGKVATRVENFIAKNPTAAAKLFTPEQLQQMKEWSGTNRKLVPHPDATNPSKSGFGPMREIAKAAMKGKAGQLATIGSIIGGAPGAIIGGIGGGLSAGLSAGREYKAAADALKNADRSTLTQLVAKGVKGGGGRALPGAVQGAQTMTIDDPGGEYDGQKGKVIEIGRNAVKLRMPDGNIKVVGKRLLPESGAPSWRGN